MSVYKIGDWVLARRILATAPQRIKAAVEKATAQEAHFLRAKIIEGLVEQAPAGKTFKPLADSTLRMRRFKRFNGTKALLHRADLRNSIVVKTTSRGSFVGILRTARGRNGQPLANIAELNEFGSRPIIIQITPKMRRFLAMALKGGGESGGAGGGTGGLGFVVVQIPARPFIRPIIDKYYSDRNEVANRFLKRVGVLLGGDFGGPGVPGSGRGGSGLGGGFGPMRRSGGGSGMGWLSRMFSGSDGGPPRDPRSGRFLSR